MVMRYVVPRKGDVDRNWLTWSRGAQGLKVVPRKGDVDRNLDDWTDPDEPARRPPQGGRG